MVPAVPVAIPDEVLRRHLLLVAKTRRGKSSLLLRMAQHLMEVHSADGVSPALVLIDPHRDLAQAALGVVPPPRWDDVVYPDVAAHDRPFGLNLLDVRLGWDQDKAVANLLAIFRHEFSGFWGPRMEDAFRFALLTLYGANQTLCKEAGGQERQHTILDVPALLSDAPFRKSVLKHVTDPIIIGWWSGHYERLDRRFQMEVANPVECKIHRYAGSAPARCIVGQPRSTIDPLSWLRTGSLVIVNTAKGTIGEDASALLGATLLNLVALAIAEQASLPPHERRSVTLIVDEFHTMPGADYEGVLTELAKYGANLILATQSLARLAALDHEHPGAFRSMVFANLDGLFAFRTSAEDARYLVPELGGEVDEQDLVGLGEHPCDVKVSVGGERLPTFSVTLDPPPQDIDLDGRALHVRDTVKRVKGTGLIVGDTKTRHSRRRFELARSTVVALRAHQKQQEWERRVAGEAWRERDLVFCTLTGGPFDAGSISHAKDRALEHANLPHVRTHDLRHTAATYLLSQGVHPKVVQELLGHSSITLPMNTFSHVLPTLHKKVADHMDRLYRASVGALNR